MGLTAAATAAGFLYQRARIRDRRLQFNEHQHGKVCPHCSERVKDELLDVHVMLAHPAAQQSAEVC